MQFRLALVIMAALLRMQESGVPVPANVLEDYAGTYKLGPAGSLVITIENGPLIGQAPGTPKFPVPARTETKFVIPQASVEIEFVKDGQGAVTHLLFRQGGRE